YPDSPDLTSFPTRRSSDLIARLDAQVVLRLGERDHHRIVGCRRRGHDLERHRQRPREFAPAGRPGPRLAGVPIGAVTVMALSARSEEHTSELQSLAYLVCR